MQWHTVLHRMTMLASVTVACLALSACVTVEGESSGQMKDRLTESYLYKSVKRFYPDGVPSDPATVYPQLNKRQMQAIEQELQQFSDALAQQHLTRRQRMETALHEPVQPTIQVRFKVERTGNPTVYSPDQGQVVIDIRVLQAVFRGALLSSLGERRGAGPLTLPSDDARQVMAPDLQTERQRQAIQKAVDFAQQVDDTRGRSAVGDIFSILSDDDKLDSPWFRMADVSMQSQSLQITYLGAVLFLVAHEVGHTALNHHQRHAALLERTKASERTDDSAFCGARRRYELEADAYALLLLSPYLDQSVGSPLMASMLGLDRMAGYDNYFRYGYPLTGFATDTGCSYPSSADRWDALDVLEQQLQESSGQAWDAAVDKAFERALQKRHEQ